VSFSLSSPQFPNWALIGNSKTFFFFFAVNLCLAAFVWFMIPETKKVSLEEIDTLFGGSNHVEKGGDLLHVEDTHHAHVGVDNVQLDFVNNPDIIKSTGHVGRTVPGAEYREVRL
jgi:hypothetical protein